MCVAVSTSFCVQIGMNRDSVIEQLKQQVNTPNYTQIDYVHMLSQLAMKTRSLTDLEEKVLCPFSSIS